MSSDNHQRLREAVSSFDSVTDVPASAGALYAASHIIGHECDAASLAFMKVGATKGGRWPWLTLVSQCKARAGGDPIQCIDEGKAVTRCALGVFR